ncbi:Hypothetical predicted protein [Pelobates cultripes]|uniref:Uncharacterized protein n=1 Tax=Pelobates cultripes TaxID=61616 RepID=A0AAD1RW76_PELCU|nr:Hypothetical predicted protein [Pelobates cultripes]
MTAFLIRKAPTAPVDAPRNIIAVTREVSIKAALLARSRSTPDFRVNGCSVRVYDDLPFNFLLERQRLMHVMRELQENGIRYRWGASGTLVVQQGDTILTLSVQEDPAGFLTAF